MALLEVIVAMTILGFGIASTAAVAVESLDRVRRAESDERAVQRAANLLNAVSLWPRVELDRHLGTRSEGDMRLLVGRTSATVYDLSIEDSAGRTTILETAVYREVSDSATK